MKGIILAAGKGSRLSELNLKHKGFAIVQKHHIIDYSLDFLVGECVGKPLVSEIVVVVGYNASAIIEYIGEVYKGVPVKYVFQNELKGIAHAMLMARTELDDDVVMCLADEVLLNPRLPQMMREFETKKLDCVCGVVVDGTDFSFKPIAYEIHDDWSISTVTEKPKAYRNDLRGVGECIFSKRSLELLSLVKPNKVRGEYEMGDWIELIINSFGNVKAFDIADAYVNVNYASDIAAANKMLGSK